MINSVIECRIRAINCLGRCVDRIGRFCDATVSRVVECFYFSHLFCRLCLRFLFNFFFSDFVSLLIYHFFSFEVTVKFEQFLEASSETFLNIFNVKQGLFLTILNTIYFKKRFAIFPNTKR